MDALANWVKSYFVSADDKNAPSDVSYVGLYNYQPPGRRSTLPPSLKSNEFCCRVLRIHPLFAIYLHLVLVRVRPRPQPADGRVLLRMLALGFGIQGHARVKFGCHGG